MYYYQYSPVLIIHVFYYICVFLSYIKDIITIRKMHGMESFKITSVPNFAILIE
jgi:hypothetical protein